MHNAFTDTCHKRIIRLFIPVVAAALRYLQLSAPDTIYQPIGIVDPTAPIPREIARESLRLAFALVAVALYVLQ